LFEKGPIGEDYKKRAIKTLFLRVERVNFMFYKQVN